jgi:hypothetical protein
VAPLSEEVFKRQEAIRAKKAAKEKAAEAVLAAAHTKASSLAGESSAVKVAAASKTHVVRGRGCSCELRVPQRMARGLRLMLPSVWPV